MKKIIVLGTFVVIIALVVLSFVLKKESNYIQNESIIITSVKLEDNKIILKESKLDTTKSIILIDLVKVNGGYFWIGNLSKNKIFIDEFFMSSSEITQIEFSSLMGYNPSKFIGKNNPVEQVSWYEAVIFCNKLSERDGLEKCYTNIGYDTVCDWSANGYRLPTEAEWEFAIKEGSLTNLYKRSGSDNLDEIAWYGNKKGKTHPVKLKKPNALGLYDMNGNVWEWCWDWWDRDYASLALEDNPTGPKTGAYRVYRGGSWYENAQYCTTTYQQGFYPDGKGPQVGFRIVKN